jgi:hypothetical protein
VKARTHPAQPSIRNEQNPQLAPPHLRPRGGGSGEGVDGLDLQDLNLSDRPLNRVTSTSCHEARSRSPNLCSIRRLSGPPLRGLRQRLRWPPARIVMCAPTEGCRSARIRAGQRRCSRAYRPFASRAHRGTVRRDWRFRVRLIGLFGRLTTQGVNASSPPREGRGPDHPRHPSHRCHPA